MSRRSALHDAFCEKCGFRPANRSQALAHAATCGSIVAVRGDDEEGSRRPTQSALDAALAEVELAINTALLLVEPDAQRELRRALLDARRNLRIAIGEEPT